MRTKRALLLLSVVMAVTAHRQPDARAQTAPTPPPAATPAGSPRIDPAVRSLFAFRARTGKTPLAYVESERFEVEGVVPVVIRFASAPSDEELHRLELLGIEGLTRLETGAYAAKVTALHVAALDADPTVLRVTVDLPRRGPRPLDQSATETGIAAARRTLRRKDGTALDGTGTRIADIDSGFFVFHPTLYRADGGAHGWSDVNGDGKLTPGVDGIDLDASGTIEPAELLRALTVDSPERRTSDFDAAIDYVFIDENGNGVRDFGRAFTEATPAHGEPLFVIDDVNQDGKLGVAEKLLRLKTSKVVAARATRTYTRGSSSTGILAYGTALLRSAELLDASSHGTAVAAILVGGVADRSRMLGLAPGAELLAVGYSGRDPDGTAASVQWAIDQKADVILTEYAPYSGFPLDGSTEEELLLDAAVEKGIGVVNPAGNLGRGFKHRTMKLASGGNEIELRTDGSFRGAPYVAVTLLHRGDPRSLALQLSLPDGAVVSVPATSSEGPIDVGKGRMLDVVRRASSRGTHEIHVALYSWDGAKWGSLPAGKYKLSVTSDGAVEVDLYCSDSNNSWGNGLTFTENTETRTICHPATNDRGITVAAYNLREDAWRDPIGALASYSSIGPRIDGVVGMDLAAPANPFAATVPSSPTSTEVVFDQFGGTSGAGPHIAAALALIKQMEPGLSGAALQKKLLDTARRDAMVTTDERRWGKGKLDVAAALGITRKNGTAPKVTLVIPTAAIKQPVEVKLSIEDEGAAVSADGAAAAGLRARWDLDYDGTPDTPWEPIFARSFTSDVVATRDIKVEVMDGDGDVGGATARISFTDPPPAPPPANGVDAPAASDGCGCSTPGDGETSMGGAALLVGVAALRLRRRLRPGERSRLRAKPITHSDDAERSDAGIVLR